MASLGLAQVLLILGGALLLPWLPPSWALTVLGLGAAAASVLIGRGRAWPRLLPRQDALGLTLLLLPGCLLCGFYSLFLMSVSFGVDDGFFLHTSNMGMILAGEYPPISFLGEPLQGHYGKDLLTALLARSWGVNFLDMEWISTCLIGVLHFVFLAHWLRVESGKRSYGLLGAYFAFFGSAMGSRLGLVDTIDNNNSVAYFVLSLSSYLLLRWWRDGNHACAVLAGVVLGADALIYELHFGLLGLTLFSFTVLRKQRYKGFLILVVTAVILAAVEGGVVTHLARKTFWGHAPHQENSKKAWQSQNLEIQCPKDQPFYLRRDNLRPSRFFETALRPADVSFQHSRELAPFWSPSILACFWYPVWLSPLVLLALLYQRNTLAGWFFGLGAYSLLTPCLVGFGYFEGETARWLFSASLGLSVAFALTLAEACQAAKPWRYGGMALTMLALALQLPVLPLELKEMSQALANSGQNLRDGSPGVVPGGGLLPNPAANLKHHYGFDERDLAMIEALRDHALATGKNQAQDLRAAKYLVNYPDEKMAQGIEVAAGGVLNLVGLQTGLSGRLPAGLAGAPENVWCPPLFSQKLGARAFWADPQLWRLREMGVRWLLLDKTRLSRQSFLAVSQMNGVELLAKSGQKSLWRIPATEDVDPASWALLSQLTPLEDLSSARPPRQPFSIRCQAVSEAANKEAALEFRFLTVEGGESANPDDLLGERLSLPKGQSQVVLHLIGPYFPGAYMLEWRLKGATEWRPLARMFFEERG